MGSNQRWKLRGMEADPQAGPTRTLRLTIDSLSEGEPEIGSRRSAGAVSVRTSETERMSEPERLSPRSGGFPTTRWTVVRRTVSGEPCESEEALEWLYRAYWNPLFSAVLRMGFRFHEAEDLTQGFLLKLTQNESWSSADASKGSLRSYLCTGLRRFVFDEFGRCKRRPLDFHPDVPERVLEGDPTVQFDRDWALQLFQRAQRTLTERLSRSADYAILQVLLQRIFSTGVAPHAEVAASLGLTEEAVKMRTVRLRKQWQGVLREEVAKTVGSPSEVDAELRHLIAVLSKG